MDHAIVHGKPFSNPSLFTFVFIGSFVFAIQNILIGIKKLKTTTGLLTFSIYRASIVIDHIKDKACTEWFHHVVPR